MFLERKIKVQNAKEFHAGIVATILSYHSIPYQCLQKNLNFQIQFKQEAHRPHRSPEKTVQINKHIWLYNNVD